MVGWGGLRGGLWWFFGWFKVVRGSSGWILVDQAVLGGGLRGLFIVNKNKNK